MTQTRTVQAVTFDAGGTLLFPYPSVGAIYAEVMSRHGIHHDAEDLQRAFLDAWSTAQRGDDAHAVSEDSEWHWWRRLVKGVLDELGHPSDFDAMFHDLWFSFGDAGHWHLYEGAREIIQELRDAGYRLAVLSNWDSRLRTLLEGMQLVECFDDIVISAEVGFEKPSGAIFQHTQQALDVAPESILHVGDSLVHDIEGARAAGWQAVHVKHGCDESGDGTIGHLLELRTLLADVTPLDPD